MEIACTLAKLTNQSTNIILFVAVDCYSSYVFKQPLNLYASIVDGKQVHLLLWLHNDFHY